MFEFLDSLATEYAVLNTQSRIFLIAISSLAVFLLFYLLIAFVKGRKRKSAGKKFSHLFRVVPNGFRVTVKKNKRVHLPIGNLNMFVLRFPRNGKLLFVPYVTRYWSTLYVHVGPLVYILKTRDVAAMVSFVHDLRMTGLDISPCREEQEKEAEIQRAIGTVDEAILRVIEKAESESSFAAACRERFVLRGYTAADAPANQSGVAFYIRDDGPQIGVKCVLRDREDVAGLSDLTEFKSAMDSFCLESGLFLTTGHVSVAAAGFARENNIDLICDYRLVDLFYYDQDFSVAHREFLRWELGEDDLKKLSGLGGDTCVE